MGSHPWVSYTPTVRSLKKMFPCCRWTSTIAMMVVVAIAAGLGYIYVDRAWNAEPSQTAENGNAANVKSDPEKEPKKPTPEEKKQPPQKVKKEQKPLTQKKTPPKIDNTPQNKSVPTFAGSVSRNPVNLEAKNLPTKWQVEDGKLKNIKWVANIGYIAYNGPTIAGGRIFVPTNNVTDPQSQPDHYKGAVMCFRESDGKHLWTNFHSMPPPAVIREGERDGLCSMPTVDGELVYYVTSPAEVICAKAATGDIVWKYDMMKKLGVVPCYMNTCSPLVVEGLVFVVTGNGRDRVAKLRAPDAPSFAAFDKKTGALKWKSNLPGNNVIEGQWANASYAKVNGKGQVLFPGGDAYLYSFEPKTGKLLWKFHLAAEGEEETLRKEAKKKRVPIYPNYPLATPVVHNNKAYISVGVRPDNSDAPGWGRVWCIDLEKATKFGKTNKDHDVSAKDNNLDPKAKVNAKSALAWQYGGKVRPQPPPDDFETRRVVIGRVIATACVHDGLVYVPEYSGFLHCIDAETGKRVWVKDYRLEFWSAPTWMDGRLYLGASGGDVLVLTAGRKEPKTISTIYMDAKVFTTPVAANGTLYILSSQKLYAIGAK